MQDAELKAALQARRNKLAQDIQSLTRQLKACDTMLAGLESDASVTVENTRPENARAGLVTTNASPAASASPAEPIGTAPPPENPVSSPPPVVVASESTPPRFAPTPEELAEITALANSSKRGRRMARVEMAIAECGNEFSLRHVMDVFRTKFGWRGNPHEDQIASAFWKVTQKRGYRVIQQGAGRTPTLYGK